jgi:hypothetical protein
MAKLNWQKLEKQSKLESEQNHDRAQAQQNSEKYYNYKHSVKKQKELLEQGIWPTGRHQGIKLSNLNEKYLIWAGQNLKSKHMKYAANNELIRRYHAGEIKL